MAEIFNGREFARRIEEKLANKVKNLAEQGKTITMVSLLVGDDPASVLYTNLKQKAAERVGINFLVERIPEDTSAEEIKKIIQRLNDDIQVSGIMVQLPLPENLDSLTDEVINEINFEKDVDGLTTNSPFMPATVKAVMKIVETRNYKNKKIVVVGKDGAVGSKVIKSLANQGYSVSGIGRNTPKPEVMTQSADVIISATGHEGLIKGIMIKDGVELIDVGAPKGDIDESSYEKAVFYTPVPGGVGPMTVVSLLENIVSRASL